MKIDVARTENVMTFTVEGHTLSPREPQAMIGIAKKLFILFSGSQIGVTADVLCNGAITRQQIFRAGAGIEGWVHTSKALEKDIQDVLNELEAGNLPGVSLNLLPNEEVQFVDIPKPGKELLGANGQTIPVRLKK